MEEMIRSKFVLLGIVAVAAVATVPIVAAQGVNEELVTISRNKEYAEINMKSASGVGGLFYWLTHADDYAEYICKRCEPIDTQRGESSVETEISAHAWGIFFRRTDNKAGIAAKENIPWYYRLAD